ncbi:MAG: hypothetical protein EZS28_048616, partial [Streblomastix strix]
MISMEGNEGEQNRAQRRIEKDGALEDDNDFGEDKSDLNLSPLQSGRQIIELLAAMEIDRPERQNTKRNIAYLERPRQCAQPRSPETQDCVQEGLKCALEFIQDYLVRAGKGRNYTGPG